ncbi:hypothetical protein BRCON_1862 [Candidatus Sumerlaea chitinivorans]|uniref:Uncharacterized protein n=1 Tax=Sumerlaea chitinivorans TaxID=2250252 RepID=A0A2Z4Y6S7_SUMC1|nr:hypothetical protein BRCON_1862 [Candidatus Sumerlaea chitinivorans]
MNDQVHLPRRAESFGNHKRHTVIIVVAFEGEHAPLGYKARRSAVIGEGGRTQMGHTQRAPFRLTPLRPLGAHTSEHHRRGRNLLKGIALPKACAGPQHDNRPMERFHS